MREKTVIVYYSYTGHTKKIAERIQKELNCDMIELQMETPYSDDYDYVVELAKKEAKEGYMPKLKPIEVNLEQYDTIIIGTPVWWYTFAPAIRTFLTENNLENKTIIPFATNAGWLGHTFQDIKKLCPKSIVKNELNIVFTEDYKENELVTKETEINTWIKEVKTC